MDSRNGSTAKNCFGCGNKAELTRFVYLIKHAKPEGPERTIFLRGDLPDKEDKILHVCQECIEQVFISLISPMNGGNGFFLLSEGDTFGRA